MVWNCLDYRHTFGSQLAQKGESLYKISKLLGNSPGICEKHYAALMPCEMRDTVEFRKAPTKPRKPGRKAEKARGKKSAKSGKIIKVERFRKAAGE